MNINMDRLIGRFFAVIFCTVVGKLWILPHWSILDILKVIIFGPVW